MLRYNGTDKYEFYTEDNKMIILSKNDIDTICSFAAQGNEFSLNQKLEALAETNEHWRDLYEDLRQDRNRLFDDIIDLMNKHNVISEG